MRRRTPHSVPGLALSATALALALAAVPAGAQEPPVNYSGDMTQRPALTGDWDGTRNELEKKGIRFDLSLTQVGQGVLDGGRATGWQYGGLGIVSINIDTQKLGLWPGGFVLLEAEGNFGRAVNVNAGGLMGVNFAYMNPVPGQVGIAIPQVAIMQFLSHHVGILFGKLDTLTADNNAFAHGKGDKQFMNFGLNFNGTLGLLPLSALGAGVIILPTGDPAAAIVTFSAADAAGKASTSGFDTAFKGNTMFSSEARVRTAFFGLTGHQLAGYVYSKKSYAALDQSLNFIIENGTIERKNRTWSAYYNFDQYLWETSKGSGKGIGLFGRFGISDGNPNPVHHFYSIGLGANGVIPRRPNDSFGMAYFYTDISQPTFTGPLETRQLLRDGYGVEAYYDVAITPWALLTPDLQVIRSANAKLPQSTVFGVRLQMLF
jgi:porin